MRYFAGQYWFEYARHVAKSLSSATGYRTPSRSTATRTLSGTRSNANSGLWTPTIVSPASRYARSQALRCGSVRRQLMHEYVQKSTSTTLPRSAASVRGAPPGVLIQRVDPLDLRRARPRPRLDRSRGVGAARAARALAAPWSCSLDALLERLRVPGNGGRERCSARSARSRPP